MSVTEQLIYNIRNTPLREYPFPHFYARNVFDEGTYAALQAWLDDADTGEKFRPLAGGYKHRTFNDELPPFLAELNGSRFPMAMMEYFGRQFYARFPHHARPNFSAEWRFIRDEEGYSIGPHTDAPRKVMSLLFYLPKHYNDFDLGTSIFLPKDHKKTCEGGPHHPFDGFDKIFTANYEPNSCFGFWKTNNSWHGVEEIPRKVRRDVLLFNIYEAVEQKSPKIVLP